MTLTVDKYLDALDELTFGKKLPGYVYIYRYTGKRLPKEVRAALTNCEFWYKVGRKYNVLKFHTEAPVISFLEYPAFLYDTHPELKSVNRVDMLAKRENATDYSKSENPPILHRKELMLPEDFPRRNIMCQITQMEERLGLYDDPSIIGTRDGWMSVMQSLGVVEQHTNEVLRIWNDSTRNLQGLAGDG